MRVTYTYNENNNVYTLREYNYTTKTFFEIIFKIGRIKYNLIDLSKNKEALKDCQKHKCTGAPVILIGNVWICGFDKDKINKELGIK